jgi:hypothetical protein
MSQRTDHRGALYPATFRVQCISQTSESITTLVVLIVVDRHPPSVLAFPHFLIILLVSFMGHHSYGKSK